MDVCNIRNWAIIHVGVCARAVGASLAPIMGSADCLIIRKGPGGISTGPTWIGPVENGINDWISTAVLEDMLEGLTSAWGFAAAVVGISIY